MYTIDDRMLRFGELMLDELGLYADADGVVCDQDNDNPICVNGRTLKYIANEEVSINRNNEMLFDPLNNPTLGKYLFGFYTEHRMDSPVDGFHTMPDLDNKEKGIIRVESDGNIIAESKPYYSDSVKYADVIMRINGDSNPDLSDYDNPIQQKSKPKRKR